MPQAYFEGELVRNEALEKTARDRKRPYHRLSVPVREKDFYLEQGWEVATTFKAAVRMRKAKEADELLEDEVWLLFKNMAFPEMNKDRHFKIRAGALMKQTDVFAADGIDAFVVECKASASRAGISVDDISAVAALKKDITDSIRKHYVNRTMRVSFVLATRNIEWSEAALAHAKKQGIVPLQGSDLDYYRRLVEQLGPSAKYQVYSIIFRHKKSPHLKDIRVPAIRGGRGAGKYYCFIIQPEKLLQVAYVHHREATLKDIVDSYQRMLRRSRLRDIDRFISSGRYFRNNIIINFTKSPKFERKDAVGNIEYGILEFPPHYSSAWIIDGQHRLYGYKDNEKRSTHTVPVVAFDGMETREQAKLFVEINEQQKPVPPRLLWDLYPDIYHDSEDPDDQLLRAISLVVKRLNSDADSMLRDHISIPSVTPKGGGVTNLTMATVCDALEETRILRADQGLLHSEDYDLTVGFAAERLKAYFNLVANAYSEDWNKGNKGLLRTNIGIRILLVILRQILLYFRYLGEGAIYTRTDLNEFQARTQDLLRPMLAHLDEIGEAGRNEIRRQTGAGPVLENARKMAWQIKMRFDVVFGAELLRDWAPPVPSGVTDERIRALLQDTETRLRTFLVQELSALYGDTWWRRGVPDGVKRAVDQRIQNDIAETPYRRAELEHLAPDRKIKRICTPDIREIIQYGPNWTTRFQHVFVKDKNFTLTQFKSFETVRDKYQHFCEGELDEIKKNLGYEGMRWIRKCIGLNNIERGS